MSTAFSDQNRLRTSARVTNRTCISWVPLVFEAVLRRFLCREKKLKTAYYLLPETQPVGRFGLTDTLDAPVRSLHTPFKHSTVAEYPAQTVICERRETVVLKLRHFANRKRTRRDSKGGKIILLHDSYRKYVGSSDWHRLQTPTNANSTVYFRGCPACYTIYIYLDGLRTSMPAHVYTHPHLQQHISTIARRA